MLLWLAAREGMRQECCVSLPDATLSSVPIYDSAIANVKLANMSTERHFPCCGKNICRGCGYSFHMSGIEHKCPFCNTGSKGNAEQVQEIRKRVAANDPASIFVLANYHEHGSGVLQ